ncbi:paired amphipathic helix protein Sin3a-like isoform X1 [Babylonia areolata]
MVERDDGLSDMSLGVRNDHSSTHKKPGGFPSKGTPLGKTTGQLKRPACMCSSGCSSGLQPQAKKYKTGMLKDVSLAEAGKYASLKEYAFFDNVRNALGSIEVYNNFLRCLDLFNSEIISSGELITMVNPFLGKHGELYQWFKEFLGHKDCSATLDESLPQVAKKESSVRDDYNMDIDYQSCRRYVASCRALPSTYPQPKCSGRTQLCHEVLNDTWGSIPTGSEDSTFVTSRKSKSEEHIYRCEDECFEGDKEKYDDKTVLEDAASVVNHHMKRSSNLPSTIQAPPTTSPLMTALRLSKEKIGFCDVADRET